MPATMPATVKSCLITGITGSGGSYLADYIVDNQPGVAVHGIARWHSTGGHKNLSHCGDRATVHECDLTDLSSVVRVLSDVKPDAIFHLASHANVWAGFKTPLAVINNNVMGTANLLEGIRLAGIDPIV
ncbi:MAG: GDP-mannose 4,6-dehydratase, partial [Rhodospirillales bacterium]